MFFKIKNRSQPLSLLFHSLPGLLKGGLSRSKYWHTFETQPGPSAQVVFNESNLENSLFLVFSQNLYSRTVLSPVGLKANLGAPTLLKNIKI